MKWIRNAAVVLLVMGMAAAAELLGEREIIFPEILALAAGAWVADRQPWRVGGVQLVVLMTCGSLLGVLLVRWLPAPLLIQALAAYLAAVGALLLTKTTLVPLLSACVLPVLLQTRSWVYPVTVLVLSSVVVGVQRLFQRAGICPAASKEQARPQPDFLRRESARWAKLLAGVVALGIAAMMGGWTFLVAPPLLVAYAELSNPQGKPRSRPGSVLFLLVGAAWMGTLIRLLACERWGLPLWAGAGISALLILAAFAAAGVIFPPAGAMALLPMLLEISAVKQFSLQATVGCLLFMGAAMVQFRAPGTERGLPGEQSPVPHSPEGLSEPPVE